MSTSVYLKLYLEWKWEPEAILRLKMSSEHNILKVKYYLPGFKE